MTWKCTSKGGKRPTRSRSSQKQTTLHIIRVAHQSQLLPPNQRTHHNPPNKLVNWTTNLKLNKHSTYKWRSPPNPTNTQTKTPKNITPKESPKAKSLGLNTSPVKSPRLLTEERRWVSPSWKASKIKCTCKAAKRSEAKGEERLKSKRRAVWSLEKVSSFLVWKISFGLVFERSKCKQHHIFTEHKFFFWGLALPCTSLEPISWEQRPQDILKCFRWMPLLLHLVDRWHRRPGWTLKGHLLGRTRRARAIHLSLAAVKNQAQGLSSIHQCVCPWSKSQFCISVIDSVF